MHRQAITSYFSLKVGLYTAKLIILNCSQLYNTSDQRLYHLTAWITTGIAISPEPISNLFIICWMYSNNVSKRFTKCYTNRTCCGWNYNTRPMEWVQYPNHRNANCLNCSVYSYWQISLQAFHAASGQQAKNSLNSLEEHTAVTIRHPCRETLIP